MPQPPDETLVTPVAADDEAHVVVRESPYNAETAPGALLSPITPAGAHYVRAHFGPPPLDPRRHRIAVEGAVAHPFELSLAELRDLPARSVTVTMECAGNYRAEMTPLPPGEPWRHGAVSTAHWNGPPLALVLERAGVRDDAVEIVVTGADRGHPEGAASASAVPFARALPLDVARGADVILALEMNGAPLPIEHGAPVRLVVPGWYGMANVKWVARIAAHTDAFGGWFQTGRYVYQHGAERHPVDLMRVKSLVVSPAAEAAVPAGPLWIAGWAWSGAASIASVDVSLDAGPFVQALLDPPLARHAWRRFRLQVDVRQPGRHSLRTRARDEAGRIQPDHAEWNDYGYGNHAVSPHFFYSV